VFRSTLQKRHNSSEVLNSTVFRVDRYAEKCNDRLLKVSKQLREVLKLTLQKCCGSPESQDFNMLSVVDCTNVLCPGNIFFPKTSQNTKVVCHIMWTYDICAADPGTYYDYYRQNHDKFQRCKQNTTFRQITGNKYSKILCHKEINDGVVLSLS